MTNLELQEAFKKVFGEESNDLFFHLDVLI